MKERFQRLARKVARELFPAHVEVWTSFDRDWMREETSDSVEIRIADRRGGRRYGIANIAGQLLRSPQLEDAIRHELRHVAKLMGYTTPQSAEDT